MAALLKDVKFAQKILKGVIGEAHKFALHPGSTKQPGEPPGAGGAAAAGMIEGRAAKCTVLSPSFKSVRPACQELAACGRHRLQVKFNSRKYVIV